MAEIILFFDSRIVQMLMLLLEESFRIYSNRSMTICALASCQDILTGSLYLGPLKTHFLNLAPDILI